MMKASALGDPYDKVNLDYFGSPNTRKASALNSRPSQKLTPMEVSEKLQAQIRLKVKIFMHSWSDKDASSRFIEMMNACSAEGPQMVVKDGVEAAVLVCVEDWSRLKQNTGPSLKELLLTQRYKVDLLIPDHGHAHRCSRAVLDH